MDVKEFTEKYFALITKTMNERKRDGTRILNAILKATMALVNNDGTCTNEELFWRSFTTSTQISREEIEPEFLYFYEHVVNNISSGKQGRPMIEAVSLLKENGYRLYLTTNPLFPSIATQKRDNGQDFS